MSKKILIGIFVAMLVGFPILTFIFMPKGTEVFSENENRYLEDFPKFTWENIKDESFMDGFSNWFSDRFILREQFILCKNKVEMMLGQKEISGVFTSHDQMMQKWSDDNPMLTAGSIDAINSFVKKHPNSNSYMILAPTSQEMFPDYIPKYADIDSQKDYVDDVYSKLDNTTGINVIDSLSNHTDQYIYYRTDHHWTTLGAYIAYKEAAQYMDLNDKDISDYEIETVSESFRGTLYSKTLDSSITPDSIDFYHNGFDENATMSVVRGDDIIDYDSIYFREYLDKKDKYSSFLGQNEALIKIHNNNNTNGKTLLLIKDSYANCFVPFLIENYEEITIIDLRYYNDINDLNNMQYDDILFMYNVITFSEDTNVVKLGVE